MDNEVNNFAGVKRLIHSVCSIVIMYVFLKYNDKLCSYDQYAISNMIFMVIYHIIFMRKFQTIWVTLFSTLSFQLLTITLFYHMLIPIMIILLIIQLIYYIFQ